MGHQRQSAPVQVRIKQGRGEMGEDEGNMQPDRSQLQSRGSSRAAPAMPKVDEVAAAADEP